MKKYYPIVDEYGYTVSIITGEEYDEAYGAMHPDYRPATLGAFTSLEEAEQAANERDGKVRAYNGA